MQSTNQARMRSTIGRKVRQVVSNSSVVAATAIPVIDDNFSRTTEHLLLNAKPCDGVLSARSDRARGLPR